MSVGQARRTHMETFAMAFSPIRPFGLYGHAPAAPTMEARVGLIPQAAPVFGAGSSFEGTSGNDVQTGTSGDDFFNYTQGGFDTLDGGDGNDTFKMGEEFNELDQINGGEGNDTLIVRGDYFGGSFDASGLTSVETIVFERGQYGFAFLHDNSVGAGEVLTVDTRGLAADNFIELMAYEVTDGTIVYEGGAGTDEFIVGAGQMVFNGRGHDDRVHFLSGYDGTATVNGGSGTDTIVIQMSAPASFLLSGANLANVEEIGFAQDGLSGFAADVITDDALIRAGDTLTVRVDDHAVLHFDGSAETNGRFVLEGGTGNDVLVGGKLGDTFHIGQTPGYYGVYGSGDDIVEGGAGADVIYARARFAGTGDPSLTAADTLDGGDGFDTLVVQGKFNTLFTAGATTIQSIEKLVFEAGFDYKFALDAANVADGQTLVVDGSALGPGDSLQFFAPDNAAHFDITGGDGDDALYGGARSDTIMGGINNDVLMGKGGVDTLDGDDGYDQYLYSDVRQSSSTKHDIIQHFDFTLDVFALTSAVTGIDAAVAGGALSASHFDAFLAAAVGSAQLAENHAVLFTPDSGNLAGHLFLIVDAGGGAGYQSGKDYVFELDGTDELASLDTSDFTLFT